MTSDAGSANERVRIIIADDHELVLEGLRALLQNEPDMEVIATVTDGDKLMDAVHRMRPDLVVVDLQMPVMGGLTCLEQIREEDLPVKVLVLTAFGDGESLQMAWEREADGFALKTDPPRQTVAAISNVAHGHLVFPRGARHAPARQAGGQPNPLAVLSEREGEFLALAAEGMTNAQIADRLSVTEHTVKFHLQNIFQKLGVANRTEAARLYHEHRPRPL